MPMPPRAFTPKTGADIWLDRIGNNIILGTWGHPFPTGPTSQNLFDLSPDASVVGLEDLLKFYPKPGSMAIQQGIVTLVGANKDGSRTDIGLYGGGFASQARVSSYSVRDMVIFRYTAMTMFSPSLKRFINAMPLTGYSLQQHNIRCAVSFNGGHTFLAWNESAAAWAVINMDRFKDQANTPQDLANRLINMGDVGTRGEIVIAWGMWTTDPTQTPIIRGIDLQVQSDGLAIKPIWPDQLDMLISDESIMLTNIGHDRLYNITVVVY